MDAIDAAIRSLAVALIVLLSGCGWRSVDTIRHQNQSYNAVDVFGTTPPALQLARAAAQGKTSEVKQLIAGGVDPNSVSKYDITPLWWAAWAENLPGFTALLEHGANPNFRRKEGFSLMTLLCRMRDPRFLEAALMHGANPNFRDTLPDETPLFEAVMYSESHKQVELLLNAGASVNAQDGGGDTPLMRAIAARGDYRLVWELLHKGADIWTKTTSGKTLADYVETRVINPDGDQYQWRQMVIKFLRQRGMKVHRPANERARGQ